jgi:hypothetical protein
MTTLSITCPECDKPLKVPAEAAGKKVRCRACDATFVVKAPAPAAKAAKKAAPAAPLDVVPLAEEKPKAAPKKKPAKAAPPDDDKEATPYAVARSTELATRCPYCTHELEEGQVVCLNCGYDTITRERHATVATYAHTFWDWFFWLLPAVACVFLILFLITFDVLYVLLASVEGLGELSGGWLSFLGYNSIKFWVCVITVFFMWHAGKWAFIRFVFHPVPPEKLKRGEGG